MKFLKRLGLGLAAILLAANAFGAYVQPLGGSIFPLTLVTQPVTNLNDAYNEMLQLINAQTVGISTVYPGAASLPVNGIDTSQVLFSANSLQSNPVVQVFRSNLYALASYPGTVGGLPLLLSQAGRTIYPQAAITVMDSGIPATCLGMTFTCEPSNARILLMSFASVFNNPLTSVAGAMSSGAIMSSGMLGCAAGDAVYVSTTGNACTTVTNFFVSFPYTVQ